MAGDTHQVFFLSFRGSCLVSASLSEVWLALRFWRSALWPTSHPALELGFHCVGFWGLVSLPCALSLGQGQRSIRQLFAVSMLCWFSDCFPILQCHLTLDVAHWLRRWVLLTAICPILGSSLSPSHCQPFCFSSLFLLKIPTQISSFLLPPSPVLSEHPTACAVCSFSVSCLLLSIFFLWGRHQSVQRTMLVYHRGSCGNTACHIFAHLLVCVSQAGLEWTFGSVGALMFSQCNVAWRSHGGSGCQIFYSSWCFFFCQVWLQHLRKFFIYGAHSVCFCPLKKWTTLCSLKETDDLCLGLLVLWHSYKLLI
jgi:hypothetical protein